MYIHIIKYVVHTYVRTVLMASACVYICISVNELHICSIVYPHMYINAHIYDELFSQTL